MKLNTRNTTVIYTVLSLLGALLFLLATSNGDYSSVERLGGAVWTFLLLMIILMPAVSALFKK